LVCKDCYSGARAFEACAALTLPELVDEGDGQSDRDRSSSDGGGCDDGGERFRSWPPI
jgi:hypothetical protein